MSLGRYNLRLNMEGKTILKRVW